MLRRLAERSRPADDASPLLQRDSEAARNGATCSTGSRDANADGLPMIGQVLTRPIGIMLGFEISQNPFIGLPELPARSRICRSRKQIAALRDPELRAHAARRSATTDTALASASPRWDRIFPLGDPPNYEPPPEQSVAARARARGRAAGGARLRPAAGARRPRRSSIAR